MDAEKVLELLKEPCDSEGWHTLLDLMSEGYRGMYVILRILYERKDDVVAGELAKEMNVSTARVATALNALEGKGYVRRETDIKDARRVIIRLTKDGERAFVTRKNEVVTKLQPMLDKLSDEEILTLWSLMNKLLK